MDPPITHGQLSPQHILCSNNLENHRTTRYKLMGVQSGLPPPIAHFLWDLRAENQYLAPELFTRESITTKVDIYSLGILVFVLVRDAQPSADFESLSKFRHSESQFSQLVEIKENDWCSKDLREFINHCLRRDPDQRPTA